MIEKSGRFYYAFYAREFSGPVRLRGLAKGRYRVRDYFHGRDLGEASGEQSRLQIAFQNFLVVEAIPL